ncbi:mucoidy inhibitor MuiA family protein [Alsobacter sp. R-9]
MTRSALLAATALAAVLPQAVSAAEIEAESRIEAVTVFPDGASVVRAVPLRVPAGSHTIVLRGLAGTVDPASIRVEGQGSARLAIGSVDVRAVPGDAQPAVDPALEKRITARRQDRDRLQARIDSADAKRVAIEKFAETGGGTPKDGPPLPVDRLVAAWDAVGDALEKVNAQLVDLRIKAKELDDEIEALEQARPKPVPGRAPKRDVTIALESPVDAEAALKVTYRVAGARWTPVYDVRLDTGARDRKPSLDVVRRAQVAQTTGEDWADVALTVSTVQTARGTQAPELREQTLSLFDPAELARRNEVRAKSQREIARAAPLAAAAPPARMDLSAEPEAIAETTAEAVTGGFQAAFRVPGKATLSADGTQRTYALATRTLDPALVVKTAPVLDDTAYLEASFTLEDDVPLLAGPVTLQRDGVYVGRGRLQAKAPGERIDLGFGADDKVKVTRVPLKRQASDPGWIGNTRSDVRAFRTTVRNLHDTPLRIVVVDQTPVSENASVTVEPLSGMTAPTEKTFGDQRGVVAWSYDYKPGEQREIQHGYKIAWPADKELVTGGRPQPLLR